MYSAKTPENSTKYQEDFYPVDEEAVDSYHLELKNGRLRGDVC